MKKYAKEKVCEIVDEIMRDRNIGSIRDALITVKEKIMELPDYDYTDFDAYPIKIHLRSPEPNLNVLAHCTAPYMEGDEYLYIDPVAKIDSHCYGAFWFDRK